MKRIGMVFPGQGSQYPGMGKKLYDNYEEARAVFEEAKEALGYDLSSICFEGSVKKLNDPEIMFPAIIAVSVAAYRVYMKTIKAAPILCAGHSLGEYSALTCSGAIQLKDALNIAKMRGRLAKDMSQKQNSCMTVVDGGDRYLIEKLCNEISSAEEKVVISCYNSPEQFVIAGNEGAVMKVEEQLHNLGLMVTPILMSAPFHCYLMESAEIELKEALKKYSFADPLFPVLSNVEAIPYIGTNKIIDNLSKQLTHCVNWKGIMDYFSSQRINTVIEFGPQNVLRNLTKANLKTVRAFSFLNEDDQDELMNYILKDAKIFPTVADECLKVAVGIPNSNWDSVAYQEKVVKYYKKIEKMRNLLFEEQREETDYDITRMLIWFIKIMEGKNISLECQRILLFDIFISTGIQDRFSVENLFSVMGGAYKQ